MSLVLKQWANQMRPLLIFFCSMFFDRKYLTGRHFDLGFNGFRWAFRSIWTKNILRLASPRPWPTAVSCHISDPNNITFHPDDLNNFQSPGVYFQNSMAHIYIGRGVYIAPNVGLITVNHSLHDLDSYETGRDIVLGDRCWIGMNAVILPGVVLGPQTIVGAGAVVSKSFPDGHVVLGGTPATIIKNLNIK